MQEEQEKKGQPIGTRVFKLIDGSLVFGKCETVVNNAGVTEILIKHPYTAYQGGIVQLENGDWWGFSMLDFLSVLRLVLAVSLADKHRITLKASSGNF